MTQLHYTYNGTQYCYQATVGDNTVAVDTDILENRVVSLARLYYDNGMSWQDSHERAREELSQAEAWISPHMEGVKINGMDYVETFQTRVAEFVREDLITREPVPGKSIAVKYINEPLQKIALAELDKQGK